MNTRTTTSQSAPRTHELEHQQLLVLADRPGTRIKVLSGGVWLTEEGQPEDHFAQPGQELRLTHRGRAIVEGIGRTRLQLIQPALGMAWRFGALWPAPQALLPRALALVLSLAIALALPEMLSRSLLPLDSQVALAGATQVAPVA